MPYRRWVLNRELGRQRQHELEHMVRKVNRIAKHSVTEAKVVADFPEIQKYLDGRFPDIDISDVKIYMSTPEVIEKEGFKNIGGCYINLLKVILVKNNIKNKEVRGKFKKMMQESCELDIEPEDVLVHELIHAVSHRINRASSRYRHMEEEFVYTNCIDFYYKKGMSDDDIVNNNFLPFCLQDIYESGKEMSNIFAKVNRTIDEIRQMTEEEYARFLNKNAEVLIPLIKLRAQKKAHKMIELYHKYGAKMHKTSSAEVVEDKTAMRFSSLDLD